MRVHADTHRDATVYLDGALVDKGIEADDVDGWVDVLVLDEAQALPKPPESVAPLANDDGSEHRLFKVARLRGAVRIELGDETGG